MKIVVYTKPNCGACADIKLALENKDIEFDYTDMTGLDMNSQNALRADAVANKQRSMPLIYIDGDFITTEDFKAQILA